MRKAVSFLFIIMSVTLVTYGQLDPQYTNNMYYKLGVNPGFAGTGDAITGLMINRYQWSGSSKVLVFSADAAVNAFDRTEGIGISVLSDKLGFYDNTWVTLSLAHRVTTSIGILGLGLSPGLFNYSVNGEWVIPEGDVYTPAETDPSIPQGEASQIAFDVGFGAFLYTSNYYAGFSATHLNQGAVKYDEVAVDFLVRHYYLMGGYNIKLADPLFELWPSFLVKTDLASVEFDINANIVYNDKFWGGLSYRHQDAVALLLGMELFNGMRIGYSFDFTTSAMSRSGFGSHEVFVSYSLDLERNRNQKYKSIRFL
ncbi:PorP/SprF family type IX secretion system membrane protein [Draconibacterium mangrovi]|uniref:PorP/SprF family type IX secretion system membrane protein n=1 Tax=Draconibacterium mangrovi TaxID=2697469 RepID=UPI0021D0BD43|nr:type IX secretion system membrane protein PorP/SprF [Draconibacterium mangrovi]